MGSRAILTPSTDHLITIASNPRPVRNLGAGGARARSDVILICNLVDQEIAPGGTASNAQFCAAAIQSRACLLRVNRAECGPRASAANVRCSRKRQLATKVRRVVKGQSTKSLRDSSLRRAACLRVRSLD